jgi:hypothetical protein
MQWADVTKPPSVRTLRQFAGLWLLFFCGLAAWRALQSGLDPRVALMAIVGLGIGTLGLIRPPAVRFVYTAWMCAAFPIGWTMTRLVLGLLFFGLFTPVAIVFRVIGRDPLHRRSSRERQSYWSAKPGSADPGDYFRQF